MRTLAPTIAPSRGHSLGAALSRVSLLAVLALLAAPPASALPPDSPPVRVGIWLGGDDGDGTGASAGQSATGGYQVCWQFYSGPSTVGVEPQGGGVLVYFPFVGPLATLNEEIDPVPEEEPFHKVPDKADQPVSLGTQEAGASRYC
jgi:hypothetical protein